MGIESWIVPFGKYKGETYSEMLRQDPNYAKWFATIVKSLTVKNWLLEQISSEADHKSFAK